MAESPPDGFLSSALLASSWVCSPSTDIAPYTPISFSYVKNYVSMKLLSVACGFIALNCPRMRRPLLDPVNSDEEAISSHRHLPREVQPIVNCGKKVATVQADYILSQVSQTHEAIMTLDKTISSLEMQLAAARSARADSVEGSLEVTKPGVEQLKQRAKVFFVMGIITAFSSRMRRDSIRDTWMPKGEELKKLEKEKGIIIRFVIGHSATPGGVLDRAVDAEDDQHKDFLRLMRLKLYGEHGSTSSTSFNFNVSLGLLENMNLIVPSFLILGCSNTSPAYCMIGSTLARHRSKPRVYIGCMKSGLVLSQKGVKYHEPEYWKFGEEGNKYFRHATGQVYAISKDLATYISVNRLSNMDNSFPGIYSIDMQMRMSLWDPGLLALTLSILMIEASAVGHLQGYLECALMKYLLRYTFHALSCNASFGEELSKRQIVSGKLKLGTLVVHHMTGAAVAFVNL
ncbi:protein of unknown function DUF4094 [Dillenia turbinata]|uniref:Hexosyltransferase n=1 Tax=Dillenia turbinata TaxID=194707 RepID=A0AAN8VIE0_9MAGN